MTRHAQNRCVRFAPPHPPSPREGRKTFPTLGIAEHPIHFRHRGPFRRRSGGAASDDELRMGRAHAGFADGLAAWRSASAVTAQVFTITASSVTASALRARVRTRRRSVQPKVMSSTVGARSAACVTVQHRGLDLPRNEIAVGRSSARGRCHSISSAPPSSSSVALRLARPRRGGDERRASAEPQASVSPRRVPHARANAIRRHRARSRCWRARGKLVAFQLRTDRRDWKETSSTKNTAWGLPMLTPTGSFTGPRRCRDAAVHRLGHGVVPWWGAPPSAVTRPSCRAQSSTPNLVSGAR